MGGDIVVLTVKSVVRFEDVKPSVRLIARSRQLPDVRARGRLGRFRFKARRIAFDIFGKKAMSATARSPSPKPAHAPRVNDSQRKTFIALDEERRFRPFTLQRRKSSGLRFIDVCRPRGSCREESGIVSKRRVPKAAKQDAIVSHRQPRKPLPPA